MKLDLAESTRERLLRATAAVLAERGYAQTRLSEIAQRTGMQASGLYYYFASRDDLVAEVMRVGQERVREHVEEALSVAGPDPLDRIDAAVEAHLRIELELSDFAAAVTRNAGHVPEPIRATLQRESAAYHDLWRQLMSDASSAGRIDAGLDPAVARMLIIGALNWAVEWWSPDRSIDHLIGTARRLVRRALSAS